MITLSIIVLTFNTPDLTLKCIQSLVGQYRREFEQSTFEIIVVDNGSKEEFNPSTSLRAKFKVIRNEENFGFSKGNNIGAREARGKYLLFLNSDCEVRDRGLISMVSYLDRKEEVAVIGGKLKNSDGSLQPSSGPFYHLGILFLVLIGFERLGFIRSRLESIARVDWVSGAFMMVRGEVFQRLEGYDEHIFMYLEDMEFCYRVQQAGYGVYFYPDAQALHKEHGSSDRSFAIIQIYKSIPYFYRKHKPYWQYVLVKLLLRVKAYIALILGSASVKETYAKALKSI